MAKKAFCVGINDYPYEENDLNGCVNDARAWADLLVSHFDFPKSDVKLITDSETVYVVAHRRSFPIACYLAYALSQMNVRNVLVDHSDPGRAVVHLACWD